MNLPKNRGVLLATTGALVAVISVAVLWFRSKTDPKSDTTTIDAIDDAATTEAPEVTTDSSSSSELSPAEVVAAAMEAAMEAATASLDEDSLGDGRVVSCPAPPLTEDPSLPFPRLWKSFAIGFGKTHPQWSRAILGFAYMVSSPEVENKSALLNLAMRSDSFATTPLLKALSRLATLEGTMLVQGTPPPSAGSIANEIVTAFTAAGPDGCGLDIHTHGLWCAYMQVYNSTALMHTGEVKGAVFAFEKAMDGFLEHGSPELRRELSNSEVADFATLLQSLLPAVVDAFDSTEPIDLFISKAMELTSEHPESHKIVDLCHCAFLMQAAPHRVAECETRVAKAASFWLDRVAAETDPTLLRAAAVAFGLNGMIMEKAGNQGAYNQMHMALADIQRRLE